MLRVILLGILIIVVARLFWRLTDAVISGARGAPGAQDAQGGGRGSAPVKLVRDPVCGTHVAPRAALSVTAGGVTHYFCSDECRTKYQSR